ncbi:MAG TPA: hypothetical protein VF719_00155 [Abditibacteriaceae bacterium]|jgi:hypothetical protein
MKSTPEFLRKTIDAAKANLVPGLVLQGVALAIVVAYFLHAPSRALFEDIAEFKARVGLPFALVVTSITAGVIPLMLQRLRGGDAPREKWAHLPFFLLFWAFIGLMVDLFYKFQARIFGDNADFATIVYKVVIDQILFTPFIAMPLIVSAYAWKEHDFDINRTRRSIRPHWYKTQVFPLLITAWIVWIPTVALIYTLPLALQFPVQSVVQCLWVLLVMFMTKPQQTSAPRPDTHAEGQSILASSNSS